MNVFCKKVFAELDFSTGTAELVRPATEVLSRQWQADELEERERLRVKDEMYNRWFKIESVSAASVNAILEEHSDFIKSITTGRSPQVTGEHGRQAVELASEIVAQIQRATARVAPLIPTFSPLRKAG